MTPLNAQFLLHIKTEALNSDIYFCLTTVCCAGVHLSHIYTYDTSVYHFHLPGGKLQQKKQVCLCISVILKPLEIRTILQVFRHLNDLIQIIEDSVDQTVSLPIPTSGPRPRSDHLFLQLLAAWWTW